MTTVLDNSMTADEIQEKILEAAKEQEKQQAEMLRALRLKRRKIKESFKKNPLKMDKSPLEIQIESRNE